jgi:hypothetical protein
MGGGAHHDRGIESGLGSVRPHREIPEGEVRTERQREEDAWTPAKPKVAHGRVDLFEIRGVVEARLRSRAARAAKSESDGVEARLGEKPRALRDASRARIPAESVHDEHGSARRARRTATHQPERASRREFGFVALERCRHVPRVQPLGHEDLRMRPLSQPGGR